MEYNNDFKHDLKIGQLGEKKLARLLNDKRVEVKTDFVAENTGNVFIEYESRNNPSGIATSDAEWYAFVLGTNNIIMIETEALKTKARKYIKTSRDVVGGDNNTSRGILLPLKELIVCL